jgi:allantoicase
VVEVDTTHFKGNAPGWCRFSGSTGDGGWAELIPRTRLQPDTRHLFRVAGDAPADRVRIDVYPDGGFARLRVYGELTPDGRGRLGLNWYNRLPAKRLAVILADEAGIPLDAAADLAAARPVTDLAAALTDLDEAAAKRVTALVLGG